MSLRTTLQIVQYTSLTVAAVSLFVVLFVLGDTDAGSLVATPPRQLFFSILAGAGAVTGGMIQWIGIPGAEDEKDIPTGTGRKYVRKIKK